MSCMMLYFDIPKVCGGFHSWYCFILVLKFFGVSKKQELLVFAGRWKL